MRYDYFMYAMRKETARPFLRFSTVYPLNRE